MSEAEAKKPKRIKVADNLFIVGSRYYFRKGKIEQPLGEFKKLTDAIKARNNFEIATKDIGETAYTVRAKHLWPEYYSERVKQAEGKIKGRRTISDRTLKEIDLIWNGHLRQFFGNKHLSKIDDQLWAQYCKQATVADLANHRKVLGFFLRWCKKRGKIKALPEFEIPQVKRRKRPILTPDQIRALITNAEGHGLLFIALYLFMGVRRSEILQLRWDAIDFDRRTMIIHDETTRTRRGRTIPINDFVHQLLLRALADQQSAQIKTAWVFPKRYRPKEHMCITGIRYAWNHAVKGAGLWSLGIQPHDLRATFEYYANKRAEFTDMQREKMAGASIKVQSKRYVTFDADDVRGLEDVVQIEGLSALILTKMHAKSRKAHGETAGKTTRGDEETGEIDE